MKEKAARLAQPISAQLELTYRCNWRCGFCFNPRHNDLQPLSRSEWIGVLDGLREAGTLTVTLTGGEPLLHPDFLSIAGAARERYFALRIFTNASVIDGPLAREIAALQPVAIEVSLHGARPETHDGVTAARGSFDAMMSGVDALRAAGVPVLVKTPLTRANEDEIDGMVALVSAMGLPYQIDPALGPRDDGDLSPLEHGISRESILRLYRRPELARHLLPVQRKAGEANCGLGRITMAIDPEGNVYPCSEWHHSSIGNVRDGSLAAMWRTSAVRSEAASVSVEANDRLLGLGETLAAFSFCPARAFRTTGSYFIPDAETRQRAAVAALLRAERA